MDREAWRAYIVHGIAESNMTERLTHTYTDLYTDLGEVEL